MLAVRAFDLVKRWLFLPLVGMLIGSVILQRLVTVILLKPDSYKVYLVGPFDRDSEGAEQMWATLKQSSLGTLDGVEVALRRENDHGDEVAATRIAQNLARRPDTLMVIGHLVSTQTRAALPAYLQEANPPIPVLLATETNPNLLPPSRSRDGFIPVLRLSPTDDDQARVGAAFVLSKKAKSIWVAESGDNPVYSGFLATRFIDEIQKQSNGACRVVLWSKKVDDIAIRAVEQFGIDWVFLVGDWRTGMVLTRQLEGIKKNRTVGVLLSDSAMDPELAAAAVQLAAPIYVMFPLAARNFKTAYKVYAADAATVVRSLIAEANRDFERYAKEGNEAKRGLHRLLGLKRASDARNAIATVMQRAEHYRDTLPLDLTDLPGAHFDTAGLIEGRRFEVWQVAGGAFQDAAGLSNNAGIRGNAPGRAD